MPSASVQCESCGTSNDAMQRFCGGCGRSLATPCPACGEQNPRAFQFCGSCGSAITRGTAPAVTYEGERRRATVLFADLSGFTRISEQLDPEDVTALIDRCMTLMGDVIASFGGNVARIIGDELMALFGAPTSHEDDAERAVRAALALQACARDHAAEFRGMQLRVGINTGDMLFGPVGPGRELTVMGDAVNLAKRLQTAAQLGGVVVGEHTYDDTLDVITYEPLGEIHAKGKSEPVRAWIATGADRDPATRRVSTATMVGRAREVGLLHDTWSHVSAEGRPHLVSIFGPPGIGKTRMSDEFVVPLEAAGVRVLRGRSLPYGESTGYGAFAQQLKQLAGIVEGDDGPGARAKLQSVITPLASQAEFAREIPTLAGLEPDASTERPLLFLAARRFLEAIARERPTILVFEDIHWADGTLLDLIEFIASRMRDAPLLVLTLARPELLDRRPDWGGGLAAYTPMHLSTLPSDEAAHLVATLLPRLEKDPMVQRLVDTSGGNPLFIEELVATLSQRGDGVLDELPTSVTGIIAARLDLLPSHLRRVLLAASVVGKVFWHGALEAAVGDVPLEEALDDLEAKDFIRREDPSRIEGEVQYRFKHMLIREVAYQTLPRAARRDRHRAAAAFIENAVGDRVGESASLLAHHWRESGDDERATYYLLLAAEFAASAWAKNEAIALYSDALDLMPVTDPERRASVELRRALERVALGDFATAVAELDPILPILRGREHIEALIGRARSSFWLFRTDDGLAAANQAAAEAEAIGADDLIGPALAYVSSNLTAVPAEMPEAISIARRALDVWKPDSHEDLRAINTNLLGLYSYWVGEYDDAVEFSRLGYELSHDNQVIEGIISGGANYGLALTANGRHAEALEVFDRVIEFGRDVGTAARWLARALNMMSGTLRELLDPDHARAHNEEAMQLAEGAGFMVAVAQGEVDLAHGDIFDGDPGAAEKRIPAIADLAERSRGFHQWLVALRLETLEAEVAFAQGDPARALDLATRATETAERTGRLKYAIMARVVAGRALLDLGRPREAAAVLDRSLRDADRLGHPPSLWQVASCAARAWAAAGRDDEATAAAQRAVTTIRGFADRLPDERRELFLGHQRTREILTLNR